MPRIIIAGGTGGLGTDVLNHYKQTDTELVVLTRSRKKPNDRVRYVIWDGKSTGPWTKELEGATAVINLSGKSINCRFNEKNRKEIRSSRVDTTRVIGDAIKQCAIPPGVWINAGGISIYPETSHALSEYDKPAIHGFLAEVSEQWEAAFSQAETPGTRKVQFRIAAVLQADHGMLKPLIWLTRLGLGGKTGNGEQYISWIHFKDLVHLIDWAIHHEHISGVINASSPVPVKNRFFMKSLRKNLHCGIGLPNPSLAVKLGAPVLGLEANLILSGSRVISKILEENHFHFDFPTIDEALADLFNKNN